MDRFDARLLLSDARDIGGATSTLQSHHHPDTHLADELDALRYADLRTISEEHEDEQPPLPPDDIGEYGAVGFAYGDDADAQHADHHAASGDEDDGAQPPPLPPSAADDGPFVPRFVIPDSFRGEGVPSTHRQHKVGVGGYENSFSA